MDENKLTHKPHAGPAPVKAEPNQYREKTFRPSNPPKKMQDEKNKQPEGTTRETTVKGMDEATNAVRKKL